MGFPITMEARYKLREVFDWPINFDTEQNYIQTIKKARLAYGLSQPQMANLTSINLRSYQRIESGELSSSLEQVYKINECLGFKFNLAIEQKWWGQLSRPNMKDWRMLLQATRICGFELVFGLDDLNENRKADIMAQFLEYVRVKSPPLHKRLYKKIFSIPWSVTRRTKIERRRALAV